MSAPARPEVTFYLKGDNPVNVEFTDITMDYDDYKIVLKSAYNRDNEVLELGFQRSGGLFTFDPTATELESFTNGSRLEFQFITTGDSTPYVPCVITVNVADAFGGSTEATTETITSTDVTVTVTTVKGDPGEPLDPTAYDTKASIADADPFTAFDSEDSDNPVKIAWSVIKSRLKTYFDNLYDKAVNAINSADEKAIPVGADNTAITDSEDSNLLKKVSVSNLLKLAGLNVDYQARVASDSGLIKNTSSLFDYFTDVAQKLSPTTLYASFAGMKTSDDSGREVVDKLYDLSGNENDVSFAGADRPEFNKVGFLQKGVSQVAVEKESENLILDSRDFTTGNWNVFGGSFATRTQSETGIDGIANKATLLEDNDGSNEPHVQTDITITDNSDSYTASVFVKKQVGKSRIYLRYRNGTQLIHTYVINTFDGTQIINVGDGDGYVESWGDWWRIYIVMTNNGTGNTDLSFRCYPTGVTSDTGTAIFDIAKVEQGEYPTLPIITEGTTVTRLAPAPVIQNALPETGTVAGVVDVVRDDSVDQTIVGNSDTEQSRLSLNTSNQFELVIFGSTGGTITQDNPFTWANNERLEIKYSISYNASNLYLFITDGTNDYFYSTTHSINSTDDQSLTLGNESSCRFLKPHFKDETVRSSEADHNTLTDFL